MVALNQVTRNLRDATLTIQDGTGSPNTLVVPIEDGDLSLTIRPAEGMVVRNRGALSHFAKGPDNPVDVSFTAKFVSWAGHTDSSQGPSLPEALQKIGKASAWTSTTECGPYCVNLLWTLTTPCTAAIGGVTDESEVITIADFHADEIAIQEGEEFNTIRVSGKAIVTVPTGVRS